ncbi:MAG: DNA-binding protein [Leeuwenhoekiella sp.]|nr:MAG: DNA-binding protein [Leeuwenhoekiella sp.]
MATIAQKIKEARKTKGISQEELAESSGVNLRTIQRIENEKNEPRGKTLQLICNTLNIQVEDLMDYNKSEDKNFLIVFHLSVLAFCVIPIGNLILPLILWLTKKDKIIGLKEIGANLLNFQILWTVFAFGSFVLWMFGRISHYNSLGFLVYLIISLLLINILLPVIFAVRIFNGKNEKLYPRLISFIGL